MAITLLIVDDHAPFRHLARMVLEADGFTVVGEAEDGQGALSSVDALRPDVVLLDLGLPDLSGFEIARRITTDRVDPPAVVLTSTRDGADFATMLADSGACGFVPKSELTGASLRRLVG